MFTVRRIEEFARWLRGLRDLRAKAFIQARIEHFICGNPGDVRPVGAGVSGLRIHYGQGYRVYSKQRGSMVIILLAGGDKSTQAKDIKHAKDLSRNFKEDE
ncbi:MAG: type II toxin-antitoxin system RelE/ParE family toxin [Synechococcaceae cyanobacterium]